MTIFQQLEARLKQALLQRQTEVIDILKLVKSRILLQAKTAQLDQPTDAICLTCLRQQIKANREVADIYQAQNQAEVAEAKLAEIKLLEQFLPTPMNDADLRQIVQQVLDANPTCRSLSDMKTLLEQVEQKIGQQAERRQVALILKEKLS